MQFAVASILIVATDLLELKLLPRPLFQRIAVKCVFPSSLSNISGRSHSRQTRSPSLLGLPRLMAGACSHPRISTWSPWFRPRNTTSELPDIQTATFPQRNFMLRRCAFATPSLHRSHQSESETMIFYGCGDCRVPGGSSAAYNDVDNDTNINLLYPYATLQGRRWQLRCCICPSEPRLAEIIHCPHQQHDFQPTIYYRIRSATVSPAPCYKCFSFRCTQYPSTSPGPRTRTDALIPHR